MIIKLFEIRDRGTFIPAMAIKLGSRKESERFLLSRAGYGRTSIDHNRYVMLCRLHGGPGETITSDPFDFPNRTMHNAHLYIRDHFDELETGAVIDVEFILGETNEEKISEALDNAFSY